MYSLDNYIDALIATLANEKNKRKRREIIESWVKLLKKHHRYLELGKILATIEKRLEQTEKASIKVASPKEAKSLDNFFHSRGIKTELTVDPKVLAGARIVWDNILIDNTLKQQLDSLKDRLTQ